MHRQHRHTEGALAMTGGYVTKPKDKLKEEIKMRKKEEKQRAKMESKVEKLGAKLAATSVSSPKPAKGERKQQKGHGKSVQYTTQCQSDLSNHCIINVGTWTASSSLIHVTLMTV